MQNSIEIDENSTCKNCGHSKKEHSFKGIYGFPNGNLESNTTCSTCGLDKYNFYECFRFVCNV